MQAQGDAWGAFRALGLKGSLVVVAIFGLLILLLLWLVDRRDDATSCGDLERMIERVADGDQAAFSEQTLSDASALSIKGMAPEPGMFNMAMNLNAAVTFARNKENLALFPKAVADYAAACGVHVPEDSPWAIGTSAG